jgi:recombination protein RecA
LATLGEEMEDDTVETPTVVNNVTPIETFESVAKEEKVKKRTKGKKKEETTTLSSDKLTNIENAIALIEKNHGKGSIRRLGSEVTEIYPHVSTGVMELDIALGIGGFARGRIIEIYGTESSGKTTLTLSTIAQAQSNGGVCAFIDAEHALDPAWAKKLGVKIEDLIVSQPDNGEQALEICESLVRTNAFDVIVIDSVASLVPRAEIEGDMGDSHMGLQARLMSQALRKLTGIISRSNTTVIFINQIRMKIGVMFGCFSYTTRVTLADGTSEKIGKIVNNKMPVEVLSYNFEKKVNEPKKILNWFNNGNAEYFLQFVTQKVGGNGISQFSCTPNHKIFTPNGEVSAEDLNIGDKVLIKSKMTMNSIQRQVAYGSLLGDGSIRKKKTDNTLASQLRFEHGKEQIDYANWKAELFDSLVSYRGKNSKGGISFDLEPSSDLTELRETLYQQPEDNKPNSVRTRRLTNDFLDKITPISLAIWIMDDGSFSGSYDKWGKGKTEISIKSYSKSDQEELVKLFGRFLGIDNLPTLTEKGTLIFTGHRNHKLQELISPYIPECMEYKLHPSLRGKYNPELYYSDEEIYDGVTEGEILDIYLKPVTRSMAKFDLEVEDNHNYYVDGVLVHNSPETTTGGNALKFYASQRLDVRKIETIKEKEEPIANRIRVKIVKNKMAPPFRQAEFNLYFATGFSIEEAIIELAVTHDLLDKAGSWYSYKGEKIGQGKEQVKLFLAENPHIRVDLEEKILDLNFG